MQQNNVRFLPGTATLCTWCTTYNTHQPVRGWLQSLDTITQGSVNNQGNEFTVALSQGLPCFHSPVVFTKQLDSHHSQLLLELTDAARSLAYCACVYA